MAVLTNKRRAFIEGTGMVIDLGGNLNPPPSIKSDAEAIRDDWLAVGRDMADALSNFTVVIQNEDDKK